MQIDAELYPWISAAALAWGLLDCFYGYRVFRLTLAVAGALAGAIFGQAAAAALGLGAGGALGGVIVGALLGGGLAFLLYLVGVFLAGFGFGAALGILLLANFNHMVALLSGLVLGVIGGVVAVKIQRVLLILSTALLGAFRAVVALAYFTGKLDWLYYFRQPQQIPALIDTHRWMLPAIMLLAVVGGFAQFGLGGSSGAKKARAKKTEDKT
ncbi:MAG: DUF4203 domain-containing protein [Opitutae bacterium]|nr:DUF4203 domain-containing protein [Opitutae bacterium]